MVVREVETELDVDNLVCETRSEQYWLALDGLQTASLSETNLLFRKLLYVAKRLTASGLGVYE